MKVPPGQIATLGRWLRKRAVAWLTGAVLLLGGLWFIERDPSGLAERWRGLAFDALGTAFPRETASNRVVVIDIDRAALEKMGPWPWPRDVLATLVAKVAASRPAAIALDILLADKGSAGGSGDEALAAALRRAPSVLGVVLDPDGNAGIDGPPIVTTGAIDTPDILAAPGLDAPSARLRDAAKGWGVLSLAAPEGQPVRTVPLLTVAASGVQDGLAVEAVRVGQGDVTLIAQARPPRLQIGPLSAPLEQNASLWLHASTKDHRIERTIPATALLAEKGAGRVPEGSIAFIGASAPEAGGLRATAADPFMPSVQIQADAAEQLLDGAFLTRPRAAVLAERAGSAILSVGAIVAGAMLGPFWASLVAALLIVAWVATATLAFVRFSLLIDPLVPALLAAFAFQGTALARFAIVWRERRAIEARFAQHLSPAIVRRIAQNLDVLRLEGEERIVTALFTDIEGFTALTERGRPQEVGSLLNAYLDRVSSLVVEHGGMIDKIVGDAVHAFFNAPLDLEDHARCAIACAQAIVGATDALRTKPEAARLAFGRTRIGIESGPAVVGDFGGSRKLDYTAHGAAINTAAKLEASNKLFRSSIAVGPGAVALCPGLAFRPLGHIRPSTESQPILVCEPWPEANQDDLAAYIEAFETSGSDRARAVGLFGELAGRYPHDPVLRGWVERFAGAG
ncbi:MAG: adenylate/guanylate cyclase domain-containing protein [Methylobacteriaceae bacterium]|nr:adenylate/guanylate cyclase domain-containing protein [Methylobacteriaceae bacterium]